MPIWESVSTSSYYCPLFAIDSHCRPLMSIDIRWCVHYWMSITIIDIHRDLIDVQWITIDLWGPIGVSRSCIGIHWRQNLHGSRWPPMSIDFNRNQSPSIAAMKNLEGLQEQTFNQNEEKAKSIIRGGSRACNECSVVKALCEFRPGAGVCV